MLVYAASNCFQSRQVMVPIESGNLMVQICVDENATKLHGTASTCKCVIEGELFAGNMLVS
jgi:hypothetical protein